MIYNGVEKDEFNNRPVDFCRQFLSIDKFDDYLKDKKVLLDVGCGTGTFVKYYKQLGHLVEGITYQQEEVIASNDSCVSFMDAHELNYPDSSFDGFIMLDCLEHCIAPLQVLRELKRVMKDQARGIIYIPSEDWISCDYHIIVPNLAQMLHLLKLAGIKLVDVEVNNQTAYTYYVEIEKQ